MNLRTSMAMQIAKVNRVRFNEAVANGHYKCAPTSKDRQSRRFDTPDMIGLMVFGRLLHFGLTNRKAAELACSVVDQVRGFGDRLEAVHVVQHLDGSHWVLQTVGDPDKDTFNPDGRNYAFALTFKITTIGKEIFARYRELHQAGNLAPEDDDE